MYAKCGLLEDARSVFSASPEHSVASWTAIISAYSMHSQSEESFQLFVQMRQQGVEANDVTFLCLLKACDSEGFLKEGKLIHNCILQSSFANHIMVGNSIICMYAKCGCLKYALRVFDELPKQNIVTWNAMIHAYGQHGFGHEAFQLFEQMQRHGVNPSQITFASVLKATSHINALKEGQLIHSKIVMLGSEWDAFMVSALIDMYTGCGNIEDALCIFRNSCKHELVTWSAMISGLVHQFHYEEAFMLYQDMLQEDVEPNGVTFVCILKACSALGLLDLGRCIHMFTALSRLESIIEVGNTLIDMYTKTGKIVDALIVFEKMPEKDVISWNAMMYGCTEHNLNAEALLLFSKMQCQGKQFTIVTFLSALRACSDPLFIEWGRLIHFSLVLDCHEADLVIGRTLIDMYARCQSFDDAVMVFHSLSSQNDASWSAIVVACIHCSHIDLALYYFSLMLQQGYSLNKVLFVSLLSACSQKGMADEAFHYFSMMESMYGIIPVLEHYCCVVDTLGRMGSIVEAEDLLKTSPCEMNHTTCAYLLNHCKTYCNVGAEHIYFDNLNFLDHMHVSCYALLPDMQTCWKM
ncbi:hypothetical protein KP509_38G003200 [Ceratopteris richardii]|nr:hypothetical protein KP509_38G003200 [Ceratopteris richardii]